MRNKNIFIIITSISLALLSSIVFFQQRNSLVKYKNIVQEQNENIHEILKAVNTPISIESENAIISSLKRFGVSNLLAFRIGEQFCEKCIDEFIFSTLTDSIVQKIKLPIIIFISTNSTIGFKEYSKKMPRNTILIKTPLNFSNWDKLMRPYFFYTDSTLLIKDIHLYGFHSPKENIEYILNFNKNNATESKHEDNDSTFFTTHIEYVPFMSKGETRTVKFTYKNNFQNKIKITDIFTSCGCTIAKWNKHEIEPNEVGEVVFSINATKSGNFYTECKVFTTQHSIPQKLIITNKKQ